MNHHDRDDLGHRDDAVDERRLLNAAQDQEVEQPDADRRDAAIATAVLPSPKTGKNAPSVDLISTQ